MGVRAYAVNAERPDGRLQGCGAPRPGAFIREAGPCGRLICVRTAPLTHAGKYKARCGCTGVKKLAMNICRGNANTTKGAVLQDAQVFRTNLTARFVMRSAQAKESAENGFFLK